MAVTFSTNLRDEILGSFEPYQHTYSISSSDVSTKPKASLNDLYNQVKKENSMRGLFDVYVVDPDNDEVIYESNHIVAKNEESAKIKAVQEGKDTLSDLDLEQYDIVVVKLGNVSERKTVE